MRFSTYTWPFPFGVRLGWATAWTANPDPQQALGRVYLLRGNAIIFSGGLGRVCRQLRRRRVWAEDLRCVGDRWMVRHLRKEHGAGRLHGPLVFVGHSCGGRYSLYAARELERLGIGVDLIVCIDVALPLPVPANVKCAVSIYKSRWRLYPARPLEAVCPARTSIHNIDLSQPDAPGRSAWLMHLTITDSAAVQGLILQQVLAALGLNESARAITG